MVGYNRCITFYLDFYFIFIAMKFSIIELLGTKEGKELFGRSSEYLQLLASDSECANFAMSSIIAVNGELISIDTKIEEILSYLQKKVRRTIIYSDKIETDAFRKQLLAFVWDILQYELTTINEANLKYYELNINNFDNSFFDSVLYSSLLEVDPGSADHYNYSSYKELIIDVYKRNIRLYFNLNRNGYLTQTKNLEITDSLVVLSYWHPNEDDFEEYIKITDDKIKTEKNTWEMADDVFLSSFEREWLDLKKVENDSYQFDVESSGDLRIFDMERYLLLPFKKKVKIDETIHKEVINYVVFQNLLKPYRGLSMGEDMLKDNFSFLVDKCVKDLTEKTKKEEIKNIEEEQKVYTMNKKAIEAYFNDFFKKYDPFVKEDADNLENSGRKNLKIKRGKLSDFSDPLINKNKKLGIPLTLYLNGKLKNVIREMMPLNTERFVEYDDEVENGSESTSIYDYEDEEGTGYYYRDRAARLIGVAPKTLSAWTKDKEMETEWHGKYRIFSDEYIEKAKRIKKLKHENQRHVENGRISLRALSIKLNKSYTGLIYNVNSLIAKGVLPDLENRRKNKQNLTVTPEEAAIIREMILSKRNKK